MTTDFDDRRSTEDERDHSTKRRIPRRTVLRVAGASVPLSLGAGAVAATEDEDSNGGDDDSSNCGSMGRKEPTNPNDIDPVFGFPSAEENPCLGDASEDCLQAFNDSVRPTRELEVNIDIPGLLFALGAQDVVSEETTQNINAAVSDGTVDEGELSDPDAELMVQLPDGSSETVTVREVAELLAETTGFHFEPAGVHVEPGDVVLYSAETPDHGVAAYHERHGRQNRVPDEAEPISSPLVPVGGYWLYRFESEGVYDFYCPPHEPFGMVHRVVVADGDDAPEQSVEDVGRPPEERNVLPFILGGLDPNVPNALAALESDALDPERIVSEGMVSWSDVVEEYRQG